MRLANEIVEKEEEVKRLEGKRFPSVIKSIYRLLGVDIADRAESLSQASLEEKKQSRMFSKFEPSLWRLNPRFAALFKSLINHHNALKSLQREYRKLLNRDNDLSLVLSTLRTGYNPNYQDMAVLEAVRGWEAIAGLPHINDVGKDSPPEGETVTTEPAQVEEVLGEGEWTKTQLDTELDNLINSDHVSLLFAHDEHANEPLETSICKFLFLLRCESHHSFMW